MILSFRDAETEKGFNNERSRKLPSDIQTVALRKLLQLHAVINLQSLRVPPGNRLEALQGGRVGRHSIRINGQWRVCFVWQEADEQRQVPAGTQAVEIVGYH